MTRAAPFVLAWALMAPACGHVEDSPKPDSDAVMPLDRLQTAKVTERRFPKTLQLTGSLAPNRTSGVASDATGKVVKTFVERGARVKTGDVIVQLDARETALVAAEASAGAQSALAQAVHAKVECDRASSLLSAQVISRSTFDQSKASCDSARSNVSATSARAKRASKEVSDAKIRAPFSGIVAERFVTVGEFVNVGTKVASVIDIDPLRVDLFAPEIVAPRLSLDQRLTFSVAAIPGGAFSATVRFVAPAMDPSTRNLAIEALVDRPDPRLKPGMFVVSRLEIGEETAVAIPAKALGGGDASPRAWVLRADSVEERVLLLGHRDAGFVSVSKGLANGEQVVLSPLAEMRDGLRVR